MLNSEFCSETQRDDLTAGSVLHTKVVHRRSRFSHLSLHRHVNVAGGQSDAPPPSSPPRPQSIPHSPSISLDQPSSVCVCLCVGGVLAASARRVQHNNKNCPAGVRSHIPARPSSFAPPPLLLLFLCALVFSLAISLLSVIFSQHR